MTMGYWCRCLKKGNGIRFCRGLLNECNNLGLLYFVALLGEDGDEEAVHGGDDVFHAVEGLDMADDLSGLDLAADDGSLGGVVHVDLPQQLALDGALHGRGLGIFGYVFLNGELGHFHDGTFDHDGSAGLGLELGQFGV